MAKILIVDDDPGTRQLYVSLLSPFGHEVAEAGDGEAGLREARKHSPGLVISDILMPTMNGYEFVSRLRQLASFAAVPVIFQSASFLDHETHALGQACGVKTFIRKPCEPEEILETVNRVLGLPPGLPVSSSLAEFRKDTVPLLLDAFYEKGKRLDALTLRLAALLELGQNLARCIDPRQLLQQSVDAARKIIGADFAGSGTLENGGPNLAWFTTSGIPEELAARLSTIQLSGTFLEIVALGKTMNVFSPVGEPTALVLPGYHPPVRSFLGIPILTGTRTYGFIYLADKLSGVAFSLEDERLLACIATKLAIAYENTVRYRDIQDHTRKLELEVEKRKLAEEQFRLLIETAPTGILICDGQGRITEANAQLQRMFGYGREALVGQSIETLIPEENRTEHIGHRTNYAKAAQARPMGIGRELRGRRSDGSTFPVEISLGPLATRDGVLISSTVVDITERKKLEQQLRVSQRLEAVGQLAAGIAHDFNNILTAITGNAKLALADLPPDLPCDHPVRRNLAEIEKASARATKVVRQILAFSRQDNSKPEVIEVAPVASEALKLLRAVLPAGVEIRTQFSADVPAVSADSTQLHQILMNLATNAADAMQERGGVIEVSVDAITVSRDLMQTCADLHEGRYTRLSVTDTGCGMTRSTLEHIFDPFFTTKPQGQGTGLGLSVVHGIMKNHGGAVTVYSDLGKGTTFRLYFPATDGTPSETLLVPPTELNGHGERVLYVDDEEPLVMLMTRMMERLGYMVTGCTDPAKALSLFRPRPQDFDVVISDLSMPGMSGLDLASELLKIQPDLPILIASGYIRADDNEKVRKMGLPDIVLKPDTVEDLGRTLHDLLARHKSATTGESGGDAKALQKSAGSDS
jgi:PAS domain S-box-containing protein